MTSSCASMERPPLDLRHHLRGVERPLLVQQPVEAGGELLPLDAPLEHPALERLDKDDHHPAPVARECFRPSGGVCAGACGERCGGMGIGAYAGVCAGLRGGMGFEACAGLRGVRCVSERTGAQRIGLFAIAAGRQRVGHAVSSAGRLFACRAASACRQFLCGLFSIGCRASGGEPAFDLPGQLGGELHPLAQRLVEQRAEERVGGRRAQLPVDEHRLVAAAEAPLADQERRREQRAQQQGVGVAHKPPPREPRLRHPARGEERRGGREREEQVGPPQRLGDACGEVPEVARQRVGFERNGGVVGAEIEQIGHQKEVRGQRDDRLDPAGRPQHERQGEQQRKDALAQVGNRIGERREGGVETPQQVEQKELEEEEQAEELDEPVAAHLLRGLLFGPFAAGGFLRRESVVLHGDNDAFRAGGGTPEFC